MSFTSLFAQTWIDVSTRAIFSKQALVDYFKEYRIFNNLLPPKTDSQSTMTQQTRMRLKTKSNYNDGIVTYQAATVKLGPASLKFQRTLRVPDNPKIYMLPPVRCSELSLSTRTLNCSTRASERSLSCVLRTSPRTFLNTSANAEDF